MPVRRVSDLRTDKNYRVYRADFHSLSELELYLSADPAVNERVFPSQKSVDMPEEFAGVPSVRRSLIATAATIKASSSF